MFFNVKRLIAKKEQLNAKIQAEYQRMDVTYQNLKKHLKIFTVVISTSIFLILPLLISGSEILPVVTPEKTTIYPMRSLE